MPLVGYSGGDLLRIRVAINQRPRSPLYYRGRRCTAPLSANSQPRTDRNLCCTASSGHAPDRHRRIVRMTLLTEAAPRRCTAGVTLASVRTRDRRTEARQTALVLCTSAMASHTQSREHASTHALVSTYPLMAGSGRPSDSVTGHGPSRRMFLTVPAGPCVGAHA